MRFLHEHDSDDPILSVVNLIDVFLVIIAVLMIIVAQSPRSMQADRAAEAAADGRPAPKPGEELTRYSTRGEIGEGQGVRAGTAYRLPDGRLIYVPDSKTP